MNTLEMCKELVKLNPTYEYTKTFARHIRDVETLDKDKFRFNEELGLMYVRVLESFKHSKGELANTTIKLENWQKALVQIAFGWEYKNKNDKFIRRFSTVNIFLARKNGKTLLSAALAITDSLIRVQYGSEIVCIATKRDQALLAWKEMHGMITKHPDLRKKYRKVGNKLYSKLDEGSIYSLGRDSSTEDGLNVSIIIADEMHAFTDSRLLDVVQSSQGAREQPLTIIISTAGFNLASPLVNELDYSRQILNDTKKDEHYFAFLAESDTDADPFCIETLKQSNPNINVSVSEEFLTKEMLMAKDRPDKLTNYLTKYVNRFVNASEYFIKAEDWKKAVNTDIDITQAKLLLIGADLSISDDMTSVASTWVFPDDSVHIESMHFLPEDTISNSQKKFRVPLQDWVNREVMQATKGNYIDYESVYKYIITQIKMAEDLGIDVEVHYDAFRFKQVKAALENEYDFTDAFPVNQGYLTQNEPIITIRNYIKSGMLTHNNNVVLNWHCGNVEVQSDSYGNLKFNKSDQFKKIDGMAAMANTFAGLLPHIKTQETEDEIIFL